MSVIRVFFPRTNARDIHLLPGLVSPRLDQLLVIETDTGATVRAASPPAGVTSSFQALIPGDPADRGVSFNAATGEVEISSTLPGGPRLRSFVVLCGCSEGSNLFTLPIRVHIHEDIQEMWLTPSVLHVRQGAENMRFGVLARFDDGVFGDITNWSQFRKPNPPDAADRTFVHRSGENAPALFWSSPHVGGVQVDPVTGVLTCESDAANERITVERRPLPADLDKLARGTVLGAPAWSTPVKATHVQGKGFSGMMNSRNILFLSEGFFNNPTERGQFCRLVRGIVQRLTYHPQTSPFDLLSQRQTFNYFLAWVPSPSGGVTVLNEQVRRDVIGTQSVGEAMEEAIPARGGVPAWNLEELLYEVGPPARGLDKPGDPLGTEAAGRLHDWRELHGTHITDALVNGVYAAWLDRADRVLLNEVDTAFHVVMGDRPRMDGDRPPREMVFNPLRLTHADFDRFLNALTDDEGHNIGSTWASTGKDEDLVVILSRSLRNGGTNVGRTPSGHVLPLSLGNARIHLIQSGVTFPNEFDLVEDPIPADVSIDTWITVAHELAHSWTLKDEYGGKGLIGDDKADKLANFCNVQPRKTLLTGGNLDGDKIKWRWPRIAKAGVTAFPPTDDSMVGTGPFRLKLGKGQGYQFSRQDIVRLRTRPLPNVVMSDRLQINRMLADGDEVELTLLPGSALNINAFPAGSVLISPRRAPDNPDGSPGDDLELVHATVRARINTTHNPLNAADGDPFNRPCPGGLPTPTGATNFPAGAVPKPPRYSSWIVGLFENGFEFDCDVYRPTGVCIMRRGHFTDRVTRIERGYEFCPVCRYVIVDLLDPFWHRDVDVGMSSRFLK